MFSVVFFSDVRETANPADLDFTAIEQPFSFLPWDVADEFRRYR